MIKITPTWDDVLSSLAADDIKCWVVLDSVCVELLHQRVFRRRVVISGLACEVDPHDELASRNSQRQALPKSLVTERSPPGEAAVPECAP